MESECQAWFPCGRAVCHTFCALFIVHSQLPPKLSGLTHYFIISLNYIVLKFGWGLVAWVLCFCDIDEVILCIQLVVGLILKFQEGFTHRYSDLRRTTGVWTQLRLLARVPNLASSMWWCQGSWTPYTAVDFPQSKDFKRPKWKLQVFIWSILGILRMLIPLHRNWQIHHEDQLRIQEGGIKLDLSTEGVVTNLQPYLINYIPPTPIR